MITLKTDKGDIRIELFEAEAPITCANFRKYVRDGFYKNTIFHRVIPGFMIQGGGFDTSFTQKPAGSPIKNEAANQISNKRGTIAMARTSVVDSATCQFFINLVDNDWTPGRVVRNRAICRCHSHLFQCTTSSTSRHHQWKG